MFVAQKSLLPRELTRQRGSGALIGSSKAALECNAKAGRAGVMLPG